MAAGLAHMVAAMSRGKKAYLQHTEALNQAIARLATLREELKAAIDADAESYNTVMKAYKAAREAANGTRLINSALQQATTVPLGVAERAAEVAQMVSTLAPITNPNMSSDLTTATALARAAIEGALANVEINLGSLKAETPEDEGFRTEVRKRVAALESSAPRLSLR
jgi:formiminotetrahydrofolate cyclodeaminase